MFRRSAAFVDKILKGAEPADLPVEQPKTAKALGLAIPHAVLIPADHSIK